MNQPPRSLSLLSAVSGSGLLPRSATAHPRMQAQATSRPRRFSPQDGRALEILGHAIDYLADEYTLDCRSRIDAAFGKPAQVEAIEMLMARSREIYFCGEPAPTLAERLRNWLGFARA
jgi:hypothetical protein